MRRLFNLARRQFNPVDSALSQLEKARQEIALGNMPAGLRRYILCLNDLAEKDLKRALYQSAKDIVILSNLRDKQPVQIIAQQVATLYRQAVKKDRELAYRYILLIEGEPSYKSPSLFGVISEVFCSDYLRCPPAPSQIAIDKEPRRPYLQNGETWQSHFCKKANSGPKP